MTHKFLLLVVLVPCLLNASCTANDSAGEPDKTPQYSQRTPAAGGTGKIYLGREISQVMGHAGVSWLNRESRDAEENTTTLLENLGVESDDHIADIGAGSGYFSIPLARMAPGGRVYAVDIEQKMLNLVENTARKLELSNIETILASETDPGLPKNAIDLVIIVDAYHEFSHPYEVMRKLLQSLKRGGRLILVEYRAEDPRVPILRLHKMTQLQAKKELDAAGFRWIETLDSLPRQHMMIFEKP